MPCCSTSTSATSSPRSSSAGCADEELGIQLVFVPEEYGGMGGGAFDVYRVCERMAAIDLGIATSVLATFLGQRPDPRRRHRGAEGALA